MQTGELWIAVQPQPILITLSSMAWRLLHGLVLASAAAAIASIQPRGLVEASGDLYGYDFEFGSEHGFGSGLLEKPQITPMTVEILKEEADAGSRGLCVVP